MSIRQKIKNMKPIEEMDRDEKDTVIVSCLMGIVAGILIVVIPMFCIGIIALVAVTQ